MNSLAKNKLNLLKFKLNTNQESIKKLCEKIVSHILDSDYILKSKSLPTISFARLVQSDPQLALLLQLAFFAYQPTQESDVRGVILSNQTKVIDTFYIVGLFFFSLFPKGILSTLRPMKGWQVFENSLDNYFKTCFDALKAHVNADFGSFKNILKNRTRLIFLRDLLVDIYKSNPTSLFSIVDYNELTDSVGKFDSTSENQAYPLSPFLLDLFLSNLDKFDFFCPLESMVHDALHTRYMLGELLKRGTLTYDAAILVTTHLYCGSILKLYFTYTSKHGNYTKEFYKYYLTVFRDATYLQRSLIDHLAPPGEWVIDPFKDAVQSDIIDNKGEFVINPSVLFYSIFDDEKELNFYAILLNSQKKYIKHVKLFPRTEPNWGSILQNTPV